MDNAFTEYYFIINPNAGTRREQKKLMKCIVTGCRSSGTRYTLYETTKAGDGGDFMLKTVYETAEQYGGDPEKMPDMRFFFAGGDGTVLESANAFMKLPEKYRKGKVAAGILPVGTGNDFLRNFGKAKDFLDVGRQLKGTTTFVDLMKYEKDASNEGDAAGREVYYCANMFNIGFDCQVVVKVNELRGKPLMNKTFAYPIGVAITLLRLPHTRLKVTFDDGKTIEGKYLLTLAANGSYCGGGFYAASEAKPDDGIIDVIAVNPLGRLKFISIVGKYKKGTLLGTPLADKILKLYKCRSLRIEVPSDEDVCVDGEIEKFHTIDISNLPKAFCFIIPEKED